MSGTRWIITLCVVGTLGAALTGISAESGTATDHEPAAIVTLPPPKQDGGVAVEKAIATRRSTRDFAPGSLTIDDLSQLLWAGQGITDPRGLRAAPSAGALYPMELDVVAVYVDGLRPGLYRYDPAAHALTRRRSGDLRRAVASSALGQKCLTDAGVILVLSGTYSRTTWKYDDRGIRYVHIEAGAVAENIWLQAVSLGLGTVTIGAFYDDRVAKALDLPEGETPLCLMPVGRVE